MKRFFTTQEEVAEYLDLTQVSVNKLIKNGEIKGRRVGGGPKRNYMQFPVSSIDSFLMTRIRQKLKKEYEKQMTEAQILLEVFRELDVTLPFGKLSKNKTIEEILKGVTQDDIDAATATLLGSFAKPCSAFLYRFVVATYKGLHKDVRTWLRNQLTKEQ